MDLAYSPNSHRQGYLSGLVAPDMTQTVLEVETQAPMQRIGRSMRFWKSSDCA